MMLADPTKLLPPHIRRVTERATPIVTIARRAAEARDAGTDLVRCDIGQIAGVKPDDEVLYGPPNGLVELRGAVAELYNLSLHLTDPLAHENVAITTGAAEALSLLFACFAYQKRIGVPRAHWENYANGVALADGQMVLIDFFDEHGSFSAERIAAQIKGHGLSALLANFPHNPTGAVLDAAETAALARVIVDANIVGIADEVYARLRYDAVPPQSLLPHAPDHVISIGSASKEYLLPGARVGYVVSRHADFTDRICRRLTRANSASPNVLGQRALLERMTVDVEDMRAGREPRTLGAVRRAMQTRRDSLLAVLQKHDMAPPGRKPQGTIFMMAAVPPWWDGDDATFSEAALSGGFFSSIPGSAFGLPGCVRLSFGTLTDADIENLDHRIERFRTQFRKDTRS